MLLERGGMPAEGLGRPAALLYGRNRPLVQNPSSTHQALRERCVLARGIPARMVSLGEEDEGQPARVFMGVIDFLQVPRWQIRS